VDSGQLGLFDNAYWGHPAYKLPPEANLMAVSHYLEALKWQKEIIKIHTVFGGKNPHPNYLVGGVASAIALQGDSAINIERLVLVKDLITQAKQVVETMYIPDLLAVASFYPEWAQIGGGLGNYLVYGDIPQNGISDVAKFRMPRGAILNKNLAEVLPVDPADDAQIREEIAHSWYEYSAGKDALHPWEGETKPKYTGPKPPFEHLQIDQKYSWLKAPRYQDHAMEVGPLSRMLVAYASGHPEVKPAVDAVLAKLNAPATALFSTLGRIAARAIEAKVMAEQVTKWVAELGDKLGHGDLRIHNGEKWDPDTWPKQAQGWGFHEAPRGSLGHWVQIEDKKIKNYQCVVPTTWNAGPRDGKGQRGAYEASLLKTPIADPERPLEILRTVHSFDPCLACAVHVVDAQGRRYSVLKAS
jgi:hydrogenase large subunit